MGVVNQGINYVLNTIFPTGPNTWYVGLINNSGFANVASTDTLGTGNHPGWVELVFGTAYTGNRQLWTNSSTSSQSMSNAVVVAFPMLQTLSVWGILLCASSTGTTSATTLMGTSPFIGGPQSVNSGDTLQVTLTFNGTSS